MKQNNKNKTMKDNTLLVRGGLKRSNFDETSEAIFLTSGYIYKTAREAEQAFKNEIKRHVYSRYANPTVDNFQRRLSLLEGAECCFATASGMAAVFASMACFLKAGDRVVASEALFGSCDYIISNILPRLGVDYEYVLGNHEADWQKALSKPTQAVFLETPSNPLLEILDIPMIADLTHKAGGKLIIDNVFATPLLQKPLELGADIVVYSTTKHIDGQGRCLGGAILCSQEFLDDYLMQFVRHTGPAMSPFNAWVMLKGMDTLKIRVEAQSHSAHKIAEFLQNHPKIKTVRYPGLKSHRQHELAMRQMSMGGTLISFDYDGNKEQVFKLMDSLNLIDISNNLGDTKSLITHPATTTHQRLEEEARARLGIKPNSLRLSVGLEDSDDLIADFKASLGTLNITDTYNSRVRNG